MSEEQQRKSRHVWRWQDEDPPVVVLLAIIILAILVLPWDGCGPAAARGKPHSLGTVVRQALEQANGEQAE